MTRALQTLSKYKLASNARFLAPTNSQLINYSTKTSLALENDKKERKRKLEELKNLVPGQADLPQPDNRGVWDKLKDKMKDLSDADKALERRRVILKELSTSYYQDFHDIRATDGKMFEANDKLIPGKNALYMPTFKCEPLFPELNKLTDLQSGQLELTNLLKGKISLVAFHHSQFGQTQADTFTKPIADKLLNLPNFQIIEINCSEKLKSLVVKACRPQVKKALKDWQKPNYLYKFGDLYYLKEKLGMMNGLLGYVYLIDNHQKIRWWANGPASENELKLLEGFIGELAAKK